LLLSYRLFHVAGVTKPRTNREPSLALHSGFQQVKRRSFDHVYEMLLSTNAVIDTFIRRNMLLMHLFEQDIQGREP